jgi:hypothetical protein
MNEKTEKNKDAQHLAFSNEAIPLGTFSPMDLMD